MSASLCIAAVMSGAATVNCNLKIKVTVLFVFPVTYVGSEDDINNSALIKNSNKQGQNISQSSFKYSPLLFI